MSFEPQGARRGAGIHADLFPPFHFIATMHLAMVSTAERDREFVADFASKCTRLGKAKMVGVGGRAAAKQAGLRRYEPYVLAVAKPARFRMVQLAFVNLLLVRSLSLSRAAPTSCSDDASALEFGELSLETIFDMFGVGGH
jgi:hypothetical protein